VQVTIISMAGLWETSLLAICLFAGFSVVALAPPYYGIDRPALDYELPPLDFEMDDLEPFIDAATVRVHYNGHHAKYTENLNRIVKEWRKSNKQASRISLVDILRNLSRIPAKWRDSLKNNAGGYVNHNLYWATLTPNPRNQDRKPTGNLAQEIHKKWSSFMDFKDVFSNEAANLFGSGYVWLCRNRTDQQLVIVTTANQDSPLSQDVFPILTLDVWEHAYYLKHKNLRPKYIDDWWKIVDWNSVSRLDTWWNGVKFHDEL